MIVIKNSICYAVFLVAIIRRFKLELQIAIDVARIFSLIVEQQS